MICLACGDCCKRMSPLSAPNVCPKLEMRGTIAHCVCYNDRPAECASHDFPADVCPIGRDILGISTIEEVRARGKAVHDCRCGNDLLRGILKDEFLDR